MKVSFITTVYNEEKTIQLFLDSLFTQTTLPDEIIIVDGGSTDDTVALCQRLLKKKKIPSQVLIKKGNRSVGRNEAIAHARGKIIVCSDSGNILDENWITHIIDPFKNSSVQVVAGYYKGLAKNIFQKSLIPYVLVMPDKVDPQTFLPATRSIAFRKSIWEKVGKFDENYSHNEDYVFAKKLQHMKATIVFQKDAIAYWIPRDSLKQAFIMFFRFAYGDAEAGILRPKVLFLFLRYLLVLTLIVLGIVFKGYTLLLAVFFFGLAYLIWAIQKNYRYVQDWKAFFYLPLLQLCADFSVILGTCLGLFHRFFKA